MGICLSFGFSDIVVFPICSSIPQSLSRTLYFLTPLFASASVIFSSLGLSSQLPKSEKIYSIIGLITSILMILLFLFGLFGGDPA